MANYIQEEKSLLVMKLARGKHPTIVMAISRK